MFDNHIHSCFSSDGRMTNKQACEKAIKLGLSGIAFTDHLDFDFPGTSEFENIDFYKYCSFIDEIKEKYSARLIVLKGIEAGIQPHVQEQTLEVIKSHDFDYVLASIHILDGVDPYERAYYKGKSMSEAYEIYLEKVLEMVDSFPDFDNVGHFEYIIRYASYEDRSLKYSQHKEIIDEILRTLVKRGKGFEINTGSYREKPGIKTAEFDISILKRYHELGGEIIGLGSDAHSTEFIGHKFNQFKEMVLCAGFKTLTHFEKRVPIFEPITTI